MKKYLIVIAILAVQLTAMAQSGGNIGTVNGSFQIDAQLYQPDEALGITDSVIGGHKIGINGYGNIIYTLGNFKAGMRYESYLTPLGGFDPRQEGNGFPYIWASYNSDLIDITIGNFYEQFGNGLTLRSYESWTLGYDNSLNGMRVVVRPVKGLAIKGVYGTQRFFWQEYERNLRGIVRGVDAEVSFNEIVRGWESAPVRLSIGGSAVSKYQRDADPVYNLPENVGNFAGRFNLGFGNFAFMTEYAYKINDPSAMNNYIYKEGQSILSSLSYAQKGLGIVLQLKRVDNMSFKSDRNVTANALDINFLPPINRTHAYSLTAKYPYATQPNGEIGLQFQVNYKIPKGSKLGGKYGTSLALNFSQVNDIVRNQVNDTTSIGQEGTLGYTSKFFEVSDHVFFRDLNVSIEKRFNSKLKGVVEYMNQIYDIATLEAHTGEPAINANIVVADFTYRLNSRRAIRAEAQGLWTKEDDGDWSALLVEYTVAPKWFIALADQYNYGNPEKDKQNHYFTVSGGYTHDATRLALTYGRQSEGVVCVGGVCRQVPASSGLTLTISTSF